MLRLRTADGLDMASFAAVFGDEAAGAVRRALEAHVARGVVLELPRLGDDGENVVGSSTSETGTIIPPKAGNLKSHSGSSMSGEGKWDFRIRLSDPEGFLVSNSIISDVFAAFSFKDR